MTSEKSQKSRDRRQALLQAAAEVFFEQGYAATSVDAIIERAGGSKRNIYSEFGNKEGLFAAIVKSNADVALSALTVEATDGRSLRETLTVLGQNLMTVYMSPTVIAVYRIAVSEANRFPNLARSLYEQGPGRVAAQLADVLEAARSRKEVDTVNCHYAAGHFVAMLRDNLHLQVVLGLRPAPSQIEISEVVRSAVDVFLTGVQASADK